VLYTPDPTFTGEVSFEYEACYVGGDSCDTAVVTVTIVPVVDAVDDAASVSILASIGGEVVDVLANDATFPSGQAINVTAITRNPSDGTSTIAADMSAVVYTSPLISLERLLLSTRHAWKMELHVIKQMLPFQLNPRLLLLMMPRQSLLLDPK